MYVGHLKFCVGCCYIASYIQVQLLFFLSEFLQLCNFSSFFFLVFFLFIHLSILGVRGKKRDVCVLLVLSSSTRVREEKKTAIKKVRFAPW